MPTSLWSTWERTVGQARDEVAFVAAIDGATLSRVELTQLALTFAATSPATLTPGQVAAFAERNGAPWLEKFLALQNLGMVALPLDPGLPLAQRSEAACGLGAHWYIDEQGHWHPLSINAPLLTGDHCLLKTTSGSTGLPRPLAFTSANMLADGRQIAATMQIGPRDRNLGAIPFGHSYGLGNLIVPLLAQGTPLVGSNEILPSALAEQIERFAVTVLPSVPAVLRALAESRIQPLQLRSLRRVISAGAPLRPDVARTFHDRFGEKIRNFYGSSETGGICFDRTGEATLTGRSVGLPLTGVDVSLDAGGRVVVHSPAVAAPGTHLLADLGEWNSDGELFLTGRATSLANIGGKKVSPLEIERKLRALDGVNDVWVGVQTRETGGGDFLLAAVETDQSPDDLRHALAERLPAWQVPRCLWVTPALPRTARGKLDRRELEARCLTATAAS